MEAKSPESRERSSERSSERGSSASKPPRGSAPGARAAGDGETAVDASTAGLVSVRGLADDAPVHDAAAVTALRERAATALERGLGFVSDYGDDLALLRAHVTLEAAAQADGVEAVARRQRGDGSFPPLGFVLSGEVAIALRDTRVPPPLVGTLEALSALGDLRALSSGAAERAIGYLTRAQRADGSFGSADPVAERAASGDGPSEAAARRRLYATGMLAGFAARTPYVRPEVLAFAAAFLRPLFDPDRLEREGLRAVAAFAHFYANGGDREKSDEALQWCGRELERGFRTRRFEPSQTLRVLLDCDSTALPGATFDTVELLAALLDEQAGDGGFAPLDPGGPPGRVGPTLDALIGIRGLCREL